MYFYGARWYDAALGRFISADTVVAGGVQGFDRYSYVGNNPVRYTDPSGHGRESTDCGPDGIYCGFLSSSTRPPIQPTNACPIGGGYCVTYLYGSPAYGYDAAIGAGYSDSIIRGEKFVSYLQQNTGGWWSDYMSGSEEKMWEFLIALAYAYEMGSAWVNTYMNGLMQQAFANKLGYLVDTYGSIGYYIFLGSMGSIWKRLDDAQYGTLDRPRYLENAFTKTTGVWDGSLRSSDPNAPFDFANPMPGKQPADLLKSLNDFANSCTDYRYGCDTTGIEGTLYVLVSRNGNTWNIAFIVSYLQWISW